MRPIVTTAASLYRAQGPVGEAILDEMNATLRTSHTVYPEVVAQRMGVEVRDLRSAVKILTGMRLMELIRDWRILQARDLMATGSMDEEAIAQRCGWNTAQIMRRCMKARGEVIR